MTIHVIRPSPFSATEFTSRGIIDIDIVEDDKEIGMRIDAKSNGVYVREGARKTISSKYAKTLAQAQNDADVKISNEEKV